MNETHDTPDSLSRNPTFEEKLSAYLLGEHDALEPRDVDEISAYVETPIGREEVAAITRTIEAIRTAAPSASPLSRLASARRDALLSAARSTEAAPTFSSGPTTAAAGMTPPSTSTNTGAKVVTFPAQAATPGAVTPGTATSTRSGPWAWLSAIAALLVLGVLLWPRFENWLRSHRGTDVAFAPEATESQAFSKIAVSAPSSGPAAVDSKADGASGSGASADGARGLISAATGTESSVSGSVELSRGRSLEDTLEATAEELVTGSISARKPDALSVGNSSGVPPKPEGDTTLEAVSALSKEISASVSSEAGAAGATATDRYTVGTADPLAAGQPSRAARAPDPAPAASARIGPGSGAHGPPGGRAQSSPQDRAEAEAAATPTPAESPSSESEALQDFDLVAPNELSTSTRSRRSAAEPNARDSASASIDALVQLGDGSPVPAPTPAGSESAEADSRRAGAARAEPPATRNVVLPESIVPVRPSTEVPPDVALHESARAGNAESSSSSPSIPTEEAADGKERPVPVGREVRLRGVGHRAGDEPLDAAPAPIDARADRAKLAETESRAQPSADKGTVRAASAPVSTSPGERQTPLVLGPATKDGANQDSSTPADRPKAESPSSTLESKVLGESEAAKKPQAGTETETATNPRYAEKKADPAEEAPDPFGRVSTEGEPRPEAGVTVTADPRKLVEDVLSTLDRRPGESPQAMFFRYWGDQPFVETVSDRQSTFALDADTASYTLLRKYITERGMLPPPEAIRTEELVNFFSYGYEAPTDGRDFRIDVELAPSIFAHEARYHVLAVGIRAREISKADRKPCNLVFVVDTSGSMRQENRLELVKDAMRLLVPELGEGDLVGIVAFDAEARVVLESTPATDKERILDGVSRLQPNRNTNVAAGLRLGYEMAVRHRFGGAQNRVILLSDGVANTGVTDPATMLANVEKERRDGVYLTTVGVGMGNHNDALLEQLADRGDGQCVYVDRLDEARRVFVENLTGTLEVVARDAKAQVEFDPERVIRYRLLGYENRGVADNAFRDNTVDAGEIGAGHEVVALYEIALRPGSSGPVAKVRLRYAQPEFGEVVEVERSVDTSNAVSAFESASTRLQLASLVGEFAEILRDSFWSRGSRLADVATRTEALLGSGIGRLAPSPELVELVALMKRADALIEERRAVTDEAERVVEAIKWNRYRSSLVEGASDGSADARHLEELRRESDELRRRLESALSPR
jgi:Ca-activated chloride channel family protein